MFVVLFMLWLILNARMSVETFVLSLSLAGGIDLFLWKYFNLSPHRELKVVRQFPQILLYVGLVIKRIIEANILITKMIYRKNPRPVIRTFRTKLRTGLARAVLANSITITPGTLTLECEEDMLTVHCLTPDLACSLEDSVLERRLLKIEEGFHG